MDTAVQLSSVSKAYREGKRSHQVLVDIDLVIGHGECVALLGRSGSGKSTLLNIIAGIDRPDSGSVDIGGNKVSELAEPEISLFRRRHIGFVYQFFNLIPTLTAGENIALPLELTGCKKDSTEARVRELTSAIGLPDRGSSFPDQLSGGEQQRIAIARALAHKPSLVLADEPTGNLDQESGLRALQLITSIARSQNSSLLLVTHSLSVARNADRILTLEDGRISEAGTELAW